MKDIKWIRELSVPSKFSIIIGLILLIIFFGLLNFWFSFKVMSGIRAYVGGEGLWSKAQKESVNNLIEYAIYKDPQDYESYLKFLQVPLGDKQARLEMDKPDTNYEIIKQGFIQGGNSPEDVGDMVFLYENFKEVSYMKVAIEDWKKGDDEIEDLRRSAAKVHDLVSAATDSSQPIPALRPILAEVFETDRRLTVLEDHFSATLSEGSRRIRDILLILTIIMSVLLGSIVLLVAVYIGKVIAEVDRFKSEFVSMASHELRTPMAAIKGFVAMILGDRYGKISPQLRRPLENISISMERLIGLSNDLLDVARIESSGMKPKIIDCNSALIIREVVGNLEEMAAQKKLKLEIGELNEETIKADSGYVRQILNNLIGNAIKFTEKGSVKVYSTSTENHQNIYVKDTGIGIAPEDRNKVFTRFQQLHSSSGHRPMGSGLGLFISLELANKMNGELRLENSEVGMGSTFVVVLPISNKNLK